jgi:hypothetical protein
MNPIEDYLPGAQSDRVVTQNWVKITGRNMTVLWSGIDAPVVSFGGLWPGYVSPAHKCVRGDDTQHIPLTAKDLCHGWIYSNLFNNNFQTNFPVSQMGSVLFRYVFTTRDGHVSDTEAAAFGWQAVVSFETIFTDRSRSPALPVSASFLRVDSPDVVLLACKRAEDGRGIILRLWNMAPHEVRAYVEISSIPIAAVRRANLVEEDREESLPHDGHGFRITLVAQETATVRVETPRRID